MPKSANPGYERGEYWNICDRCGFAYRRKDMRLTWDGLFVCEKDWEPRHPQDFVRGREDNTAPRGPHRPEVCEVDINVTEPCIGGDGGPVDAGREDPWVIDRRDPDDEPNPEDYDIPPTTFITPVTTQSSELALWYWPEEDSSFVTRQTNYQTPVTLIHDNVSPAPYFEEVGGVNGYRSNPENDEDLKFNFLDTTAWDWWNPVDPLQLNTISEYIFYIDFTVGADAQKQGLTSPDDRFITYFRGTFATSNLAFIFLKSDGVSNSKIAWQNTETGTATQFIGVSVPEGGGRMRAAFLLDSPTTTSGVMYSSAIPGQSFIGEDKAVASYAPDGADAGNFHFMAGSNPTTSYDGTCHLHELRVYLGLPGGTSPTARAFCEELVKGNITEVAL